MDHLVSWLPPGVAVALGWTLLHSLWQGAVIAAVAAAVIFSTTRPTLRYSVGVVAMALMLAAPICTFAFYATLAVSGLHNDAIEHSIVASAGRIGSSLLSNSQAGMAAVPTGTASPLEISAFSWLNLASSWLVTAWCIAVLILSFQRIASAIRLELSVRNLVIVEDIKILALCSRLQAALGIETHIRYVVCNWLSAPAVLGWYRPVVLLPMATLLGLSGDQLEAIIAHELAHIRRLDAFINVLQMIVEVLLFYHPATWWLSARVRIDREFCCDDVALSVCKNRVEFARALTLMEGWRVCPVPALSATGGMLTDRICRILGRNLSGNHSRSFVGCKQRALAFAGLLFILLAAITLGATLLPNGHQVYAAEVLGRPALSMQKMASMDRRTILGEPQHSASLEASQINKNQNDDQKRHHFPELTTLAPSERSYSARPLRDGEPDDA